MRRLGLLGGMSWESTATYYRLLNQGVAQRLGGLHSAALVMHSVDFAPVAAAQAAGQWNELANQLTDAARGLRLAGAGALVLATNTMHRLADRIEAGSGLPLLHIADATGAAINKAGLTRVALLGTRYTMEDGAIVADRLRQRFGLRVDTPDQADRDTVHRVIYDELCRGRIEPASRQAYVDIIERLAEKGAEGVILGCTEIGLLIDADCSPLPVFDSTALHAAAAVDWMLAEPSRGEPA
jgi:aspartate racemase